MVKDFTERSYHDLHAAASGKESATAVYYFESRAGRQYSPKCRHTDVSRTSSSRDDTIRTLRRACDRRRAWAGTLCNERSLFDDAARSLDLAARPAGRATAATSRHMPSHSTLWAIRVHEAALTTHKVTAHNCRSLLLADYAVGLRSDGQHWQLGTGVVHSVFCFLSTMAVGCKDCGCDKKCIHF